MISLGVWLVALAVFALAAALESTTTTVTADASSLSSSTTAQDEAKAMAWLVAYPSVPEALFHGEGKKMLIDSRQYSALSSSQEEWNKTAHLLGGLFLEHDDEQSPFFSTAAAPVCGAAHENGQEDSCPDLNPAESEAERLWFVQSSGNQDSTQKHPSRIRVTSIFHLIRNPFDSLVTQFLEEEDEIEISEPTTSRALVDWCNARDQLPDTQHRMRHMSLELQNLLQKMPCGMDWYDFVEWQNRAVAFGQTAVETQMLFFEEVASFSAVSSYLHLFSLSDFRQARTLVETVASEDCWNVALKRYFTHDQYPSIRYIGERHTGTNWIKKHLDECFEYAVRVIPGYSAWKHWFQFPDVEASNKKGRPPVVVVAQFRNVFHFTEAMRQKAYHSPNHRYLEWRDFVTKPWTMERYDEDVIYENVNETTCCPSSPNDLTTTTTAEKHLCVNMSFGERFFKDGDIGHQWRPHQIIPCRANRTFVGRQGKPMRAFYELQATQNGLPYANLLELRRAKIQNFAQDVPSYANVHAFYAVRYEDLVQNGTSALIQQLEDALGVKAQCSPTAGDATKSSRRHLSADFFNHLRETVDWETEALVGYERPEKRM